MGKKRKGCGGKGCKALLGAIAIGSILCGCQTTYVKTPEWEAKVTSHWFQRDLDQLSIDKKSDGGYAVNLNGYKGDTSEQLPAFTKEMWSGLGIIGRLAAATVNPAAGGVPLTDEAGDGENIAKLVKAKSDADVALQKTKNELAVAKLNADALQKSMTAFAAAGGKLENATTVCENGSCTITDGSVTCKDGVCTKCSE